VSAQAAVDYLNDRVFFTSYQDSPGVSDSVWCVDLATADRCSLWTPGVTAGLGDIAASPTLRGNRLYVSPIVGVDGEIEALSADDGTLQWGSSFAPGDGQVKLFMVPDNFSTDLYFSTTSTVWAIRDDGAAATENWRNTSIPSPSQPVFYAGTGRVYVGGGDGKLHVLKASDGTDDAPPITLGDGLSVVGAPTVDQAGGFVYVGTDAGVVYAVAIP
jgi:outer membrane protein assembly factor BamB